MVLHAGVGGMVICLFFLPRHGSVLVLLNPTPHHTFAFTPAELDMESAPWPAISPAARELVRQMLQRDAVKRPTAEQVLAYRWVREEGAPDCPLEPVVLQRLKKLAATNRMNQARLQGVHGLTEVFFCFWEGAGGWRGKPLCDEGYRTLLHIYVSTVP